MSMTLPEAKAKFRHMKAVYKLDAFLFVWSAIAMSYGLWTRDPAAILWALAAGLFFTIEFTKTQRQTRSLKQAIIAAEENE